MCEIPTGPWSCLIETRPLKSFPTTSIVSANRVDRFRAGELHAFAEGYALVGELVAPSHTNLVNIFAVIRRAFFRRDDQLHGLSVALHVQRHGLAIGGLGGLHELLPVLNFASVYRCNDIALANSGPVGRRAWSDLIDYRTDGCVSEDLACVA